MGERSWDPFGPRGSENAPGTPKAEKVMNNVFVLRSFPNSWAPINIISDTFPVIFCVFSEAVSGGLQAPFVEDVGRATLFYICFLTVLVGH